jgi:iron complex transport system ATP-binding protein
VSDSALAVRDLDVSIGAVAILRRVSLEVRAGEHVTIIGPNGAGKTTLLKAVMRIVPAAGGAIDVRGVPLARYTQRELAKVVSYVPQSDGRLLPFTAEEFVKMGRYPHLGPLSPLGAADLAAVERAMDQTNTSRYADRQLATLSGGERQGVLIAAALAQGASILLLDEPATFLDPKHQTEVYDLLGRVNRESGVTIVSVTHDVNAAALHADRVIAIGGGAVVFTGTPRELMTADELRRIYDTEFTLVAHPSSDVPVVVPGGRRP